MPFNPEKRAYLLAVFGDEERVRRIEEGLEALAKELEDAGVAYKDMHGAHTFEELDQMRHVGELLEMFAGIAANILAGDDPPEEKERLLRQAAADFAARVAPQKKASKALGGPESPVQPFLDQLARPARASKETPLENGVSGRPDYLADLLAGRVVRS